MSIIFEDQALQVLYHNRNSIYLLVTFGDMLNLANGSDYFAKHVTEASSISSLAFMAKARNWYPPESMAAALSVIKSTLLSHKEIVAYGSSMGAYGALKYGSLIRANTTLAAAPQWSINPNEVGDWDRRFVSYWGKDSGGDGIRSCDCHGQAFIFADPTHIYDRTNADLIVAEHPDANLIHTHFSGHGAAFYLVGTKRLIDIIGRCRSGDIQGVQSVVSQGRHFSKERRSRIIARSIKQRPAAAWHLLNDAMRALNPSQGEELLVAVGNNLLEINELALAKAIFKKAMALTLGGTTPLLALARICRREGDSAGQLAWLRQAQERQPQNSVILRELVESLLMRGLNHEACDEAAAALAIYPNDTWFRQKFDTLKMNNRGEPRAS